MTEINVQHKRSKGPWGLLLGLLLLALVVWGALELFGGGDDEVPVTTGETPEYVAPAAEQESMAEPAGEGAAARFQAWVRDTAGPSSEMGRQHEYTREGVRRLREALQSVASRDAQLEQQMQTVRQQLEALEQSEATSSEHAGQAQQAFMAAVEMLRTVQQQPAFSGTDLQQHVEAASQAAQSINTGSPLLEQRETVHSFFDHMAQALRTAEQQPQM